MTTDQGKRDIVVLGLGNPLYTDEGIGPAIIEWFCEYAEKYPSVDFIDAGTGGMFFLYLFANRHKAIFIDCAYMGTKSGTIKRFEPSEVKSIKQLAHQSLHEADLLNIINLSKELGQLPQSIVIFGIEPKIIELGQILSETLSTRMNNYIAAVSQEFIIPS